MVQVSYPGLGDRSASLREFDLLRPHVLIIRGMQAKCIPMGVDDKALDIAINGLEAAAYHFTRRPLYYDMTRIERDHGQNYYPGLGDRAETVAAFEALAPYWGCLRNLQSHCRPFGRDYLAIDIAKLSLESAAYHFTQLAGFYGAKGDSAGPVGQPNV